jgi:hypothetical protein
MQPSADEREGRKRQGRRWRASCHVQILATYQGLQPRLTCCCVLFGRGGAWMRVHGFVRDDDDWTEVSAGAAMVMWT